MTMPVRTDTRSLLSGIIYCADCGSRLAYSHNATRRKLADGTERVYERECYRCYRLPFKIYRMPIFYDKRNALGI